MIFLRRICLITPLERIKKEKNSDLFQQRSLELSTPKDLALICEFYILHICIMLINQQVSDCNAFQPDQQCGLFVVYTAPPELQVV